MPQIICQTFRQLPIERLTPGRVVGVDFAGPVQTKYSHVRKPVIVKSYVCLFVSLSVKAVHLEPVSDLTSDAFIAALRRFIARRGKPSLIMSDHGTNFVGADRELEQMYDFVQERKTKGEITDFCSTHGIEWKFIPQRSPHFGGLWEAAVKSMKFHFKRVVGDVKLTFEELMTVLCQIESCLNSTPLTLLPAHDDDGVVALRRVISSLVNLLNHFLIHLLLIVPSLCFGVGISANLWFAIFGKDGHTSTLPLLGVLTNGYSLQELFKLML